MSEKLKNMVITVLILIAICGGSVYGLWWANQKDNDSDKEHEGDSNYTYFIDSEDRKVSVPIHPQKIVSFAPSITEIIFAIGADDRLVGRTSSCDYPDGVVNITSIGSYSSPDLEIIETLNPDLIIASNYCADVLAKLEAAELTVVYIEATNLLEIITNIRSVGELVDLKTQARSVADGLLTVYFDITRKTSELTKAETLEVYFEIWESPMTVGTDSFIHDLIDKSGGKNIFADLDDDFPTVSNEQVINRDPDVIFLTIHSAEWYSQEIWLRDGYSGITAIVNGRVYSVDDNIYLRPGPRIIQALENMTKYIYPTLLD